MPTFPTEMKLFEPIVDGFSIYGPQSPCHTTRHLVGKHVGSL